MDIMSKIFSYVINAHCLDILDDHRKKYQFGGTPKIGFSDGIFTIKTLLKMRMNHNLQTFVAFVNPVRAFYTAVQELLIKVFERYGSPPEFFSGIRRMYQYLIFVLNIGNSMKEIIQEVGVRQVDNMAPVLFLFLMADFMKYWKRFGKIMA